MCVYYNVSKIKEINIYIFYHNKINLDKGVYDETIRKKDFKTRFNTCFVCYCVRRLSMCVAINKKRLNILKIKAGGIKAPAITTKQKKEVKK